VKRLTVLIPPIVQEQIRAQVFYIAQDSIDNALAWEDRLRAAIDAIGKAPGHAIDEDASGRLGYVIQKYVFERTYLIHYVVDGAAGTVRLVNFRHGARLLREGEP
jgi:plasmid stabilization system protein ParE